MINKVLKCAIYTRKSSEEGLEQDFNSLDAQREACEAYIKSQKHEGWELIKKQYNDGGFSGGTMNRPAFQELLKDVETGEVDIVVVYKVDRLTRSLMDFAKIVDVFDKHETSFVSITQQFNTTTSMGRLTLNILLSFAQFEREVTGERIRDKFAASKKKGMWINGMPPMGYVKKDGKLEIELKEAKVVKLIFEKYLEIGTVPELVTYLKENESPVAEIIEINNKKLFNLQLEKGINIYFFIVKAVEGDMDYNITEEMLENIFEEIAIMHKKIKGFDQSKINLEIYTDYQRLIEFYIKNYNFCLSENLSDYIKQIITISPEDTETYPIHSDLYFNNFIMKNNKLKCFIDFSDIRMSYFEDDFGKIFQFLLCNNKIDIKDISKYLEIYESTSGIKLYKKNIYISIIFRVIYREYCKYKEDNTYKFDELCRKILKEILEEIDRSGNK